MFAVSLRLFDFSVRNAAARKEAALSSAEVSVDVPAAWGA